MINFKRLLLSIPLLFALTACESDINGKRCIGVNEKEQPNTQYEYSTLNIVLAVVLIETIFVPIVVLLKEVRCPVN